MGGRPRIDGTRITVGTIALLVQHGSSPEELIALRYSQLTLGQVYAALAYYHSNREEIDLDLAETDRRYLEEAAEARQQGQGNVRG